MATLTVTAKDVSANQNEGSVVINREAAEALTVGLCVALDSSGKLTKSDQNAAAAPSKAIGVVVNSVDEYGSTSIAAGQRCSVCVFGPVYGFSGMTPGTHGYVGPTAGEIVDTKPVAGFQRVVGIALSAVVFFVNPGITEPGSA